MHSDIIPSLTSFCLSECAENNYRVLVEVLFSVPFLNESGKALVLSTISVGHTHANSVNIHACMYM